MPDIIEIQTPRLRLRQWQTIDFELFAALNANASVMQYYPTTLNRQQSDEFAKSIKQRITANGFGFWAVEVPGVCDFIGFVGLNKPTYDSPFAAPLEIGWRLSNKYWGRGYATEAAQSTLNVGFNQLGFSEIVAFTSVLNIPSKNVMQRLKMHNTGYLFDHPKIAAGHKLQKHCLYTLSSKQWRVSQ